MSDYRFYKERHVTLRPSDREEFLDEFSGQLTRWVGNEPAMRDLGATPGAEVSRNALTAAFEDQRGQPKQYHGIGYVPPREALEHWNSAKAAEQGRIEQAMAEAAEAGLAELIRHSADEYVAVVSLGRPVAEDPAIWARVALIGVATPNGERTPLPGPLTPTTTDLRRAAAAADGAFEQALSRQARERGLEEDPLVERLRAQRTPELRDERVEIVDPLDRHRRWLGDELADRIDAEARLIAPGLPTSRQELGELDRRQGDPFGKLDRKAASMAQALQRERALTEREAAGIKEQIADLKARARGDSAAWLQDKLAVVRSELEDARAHWTSLIREERELGEAHPKEWYAKHGTQAAWKIAIDRAFAIDAERDIGRWRESRGLEPIAAEHAHQAGIGR